MTAGAEGACVFLIEARGEERVKIGWAANARRGADRWRNDLQAETTAPLKIRGVIRFPSWEEAIVLEAELHERFRRHRVRSGEGWFKLAPPLREFLEDEVPRLNAARRRAEGRDTHEDRGATS